MKMNEKGVLIVLSGPSGSGKDTVLDEIAKIIPIQRSISMTTREKRVNEANNIDYIFVDRDHFEKCIRDEDVLEYVEYSGNYYGTPKGPIDKWLEEGKTVVLKIEVRGAENIKKIYPNAVTVFIVPPSFETLENRLRRRNSEKEEDISKRLETARYEISCAHDFDYVIINDELDDAISDLNTIIKAERLKNNKMKFFKSEV
ncbi:MAG: guanylate kinase [Clostridia bacterium]|nr:guanylate kinase [Clostridia bacterium]